jgi:hypothetical protein
MPHVLGGEGVIGAHHPLVLSEEEQRSLEQSARMIRGVIDELDAVR